MRAEFTTSSAVCPGGGGAGLTGGVILALLVALLLALFAVYRMRKKDEGSYVLDEPKGSSPAIGCGDKSRDREFFA